MDAELRFNAYNCDVIISNLYLVAPVLVMLNQAVEKLAIFFLQISQTLVVLTLINVLTVVEWGFP